MSSNMSFTLTVFDYLILGCMLVISVLTGVYFGCFGNRQSSVKDYVLGGKKMKILPIAMSVAVSEFSANSLLGGPSEVYRYGSACWLFIFTYILAGFLGIYIYLPVFYKLQLTSIYEYLEKRFDKRTRLLGFTFYIFSEVLTFSVHSYSPALAFATITGFDVVPTALTLCIICVIYTTLGGLKTVIWTDLFQFVIIIIALVTIYIIGLNSAGGFLAVWETALKGERLDLFNFGADLTERDNFWVLMLGSTALSVSAMFVHQSAIQKFLALPKFSDCVWSVVHLVISLSWVTTFLVFIGLVCYAKYKDCDPLSAGIIKKHDQMVPFYVTDIAGSVPGITGLLLTGIFSASLSSMSSELNAFTTVIYKEFVWLFLKKEPSDKAATYILKSMTFIIGMICTCVILSVDKLGDIFTVSYTFYALTKGPLLGLFTLGFLFPQVNGIGAFYGTILAAILMLGLIVPSTLYQLQGFVKTTTKPSSTSGCDILNQTSIWTNSSINIIKTNITNQTFEKNSWKPHPIFRMSFFIYPFLGTIIVVIFGLLINYFIKSHSEVDTDLLSPMSLWKRSRRNRRGSYSSIEKAAVTDETEESNKSRNRRRSYSSMEKTAVADETEQLNKY